MPLTSKSRVPDALWNWYRFQENALQFFQDLGERGNRDVIPFRVLWQRCVLVNHPETINHILTCGDEVYSRVTLDSLAFRQILGSSVLTTERDDWLARRRFLQPAFHKQHIGRFAHIVTEVTEQMMQQQWGPRETDTVFNIVEEMLQLTLDVVCSLFGVAVSSSVEVQQAIRETEYYLTWSSRIPLLLPLALPTPLNLRVRRALSLLDTLTEHSINEHENNLLTVLLDKDASRTRLRHELLTLVLSGHETTASLLAWTWYLLSQYPETEARVHDEVDRVLDGRIPSLEDLSRLPYLTMVIAEALRLYPPAWMITRRSLHRQEVRGVIIPENCLVCLAPWVTQRDPRFWSEADRFDPERFATLQEGKKRDSGRYFPFGEGQHQCIGGDLALLEGKLILATIAQRYTFRLLPGRTVVPGVFPALRPVDGLPMRAVRRK